MQLIKVTLNMKRYILPIILLAFANAAMPWALMPRVYQAYAKDTAYTNAELSVALKNTSGNDMRVDALRNFFEKRNSPLVPYAKAYVELADKHGVDWKLLPAISGLESSFGIHLMPGSHNGYGWGGGHIYFSSWEEGIDTINKALAEKYYGRGANTVWKIGPIYAESPTWAVRVNSFMEQIEAEHNKLQNSKLALTI